MVFTFFGDVQPDGSRDILPLTFTVREVVAFFEGVADLIHPEGDVS